MIKSVVQSCKKIDSNHWILFFILIIGTALRFFNFSELPYSHDELSALLRTNYTNLHDLLEDGVKSDFHPAGVQVFLFFWVNQFGTTEWIVKLPFVLASIASIYLGFQIGKKMRNETVGLIISAFLATTQYMIMHGTTARPYATGLFFTLLLFNAILNLAKNSEKKHWQNLIIFIIAGTCAAYNHHYSLFSAGIIGITGLFLIQKKLILKYLLAALMIGVLYLPHLPILLHQLNKGGIGGPDGWLGKPDNYFFTDYLFYLFHFSIFSIGTVAILMFLGWFVRQKNPHPETTLFSYKRVLSISIILFVTPIAIAYYYSIVINPILQFSIIIFTHFFLYLILFGHFKNLSLGWNGILVFTILIINIGTLIFNRNHYEINYNSIYEKVTEDLKNYREKNQSLPAIIEIQPYFHDFYSTRNGTKINFVYYSEFTSRINLLNYLDSISHHHDSLYLGNNSHIPHFVITDIQRFYPSILIQNNYYSGTTYLFSKSKPQEYNHSSYTQFKSNYSNSRNWTEIKGEKLIRDYDGFFTLDSTIEFGPCLEVPITKILSHSSNYIDITVPLKTDSLLKEILIVCELFIDGKSVQWEAGASETQKINGECSELHTTLKIGTKRNYANGIVKIYIWNPNKEQIKFKDIIIIERKGNPILYGLVDPIFQ